MLENYCKDLSFAQQFAMYRARCAYQNAAHEKQLQNEFIAFAENLSMEDPEVIRFGMMDFLDEQDKRKMKDLKLNFIKWSEQGFAIQSLNGLWVFFFVKIYIFTTLVTFI